MNNLKNNINDEMIHEILFPMMQILDEKNITKGITVLEENQKLYICFDKDCLSDNNQLILEKISYVYSETIFYSDNEKSPNSDRLEYWCPDDEYDRRTNIIKRCKNKKTFVLELALNEEFTILGISIMLANALQEQDPIYLKINENSVVLEQDIIERHEHYIASGYPDLKWINLSIFLNQDSPLRKNSYAPDTCICEINSPVFCENIISSTLVGYNEKKYITFCMEKDELEKTIKEYFELKTKNGDEESESLKLMDIKRILLKK